MKIIIIFIDLLMATVLFFVGRFFIKSRNTEISVLFLSGDYTGLIQRKYAELLENGLRHGQCSFVLAV